MPVIAHAIQACEAQLGQVDAGLLHLPWRALHRPDDLVQGLELLDGPAARPTPSRRRLPVADPARAASRRRRLDASLHPEYSGSRTQDLEPAFHDAGQFYWGTRGAWLAGIGIHANAKTFVLPGWRVVDIDTPGDWDRAERMALAWRAAEPA